MRYITLPENIETEVFVLDSNAITETPAVLQNVSWSVRQKIILLTVFLLFLAFSALLIYEMITL